MVVGGAEDGAVLRAIDTGYELFCLLIYDTLYGGAYSQGMGCSQGMGWTNLRARL